MPTNTHVQKRRFAAVLMMNALLFVSTLSSDVQCQKDERAVWEYTGGCGKSWITHTSGKKWTIYLGNATTVLNVEEERTTDRITLRNPVSGLWTRLYNNYGELKKPPQQNVWVKFGSGSFARLWYKASSSVSGVRYP